jgi:MraZ protein
MSITFRGIHGVNLDVKGRMALPVRYREQLQQGSAANLVITIDTEEHCLLLYPLIIWEEIEKKVEALPSFNPLTRRIQRLLIGHATEVDFDNHGRILIPQLLREYASLEKSLILVGQGKKIEIWNEQLWNKGRDVWLSQGLQGELPEELQSISV